MPKFRNALTDNQLADLVSALGFIRKHDDGISYSLMPIGKMSYLSFELMRANFLSDALEIECVRAGAKVSLSKVNKCDVYCYTINDDLVVAHDTDPHRARMEACALFLEGRLKCPTS